jgi:hypothetical protein
LLSSSLSPPEPYRPSVVELLERGQIPYNYGDREVAPNTAASGWFDYDEDTSVSPYVDGADEYGPGVTLYQTFP